jgi:hypothetical protein
MKKEGGLLPTRDESKHTSPPLAAFHYTPPLTAGGEPLACEPRHGGLSQPGLELAPAEEHAEEERGVDVSVHVQRAPPALVVLALQLRVRQDLYYVILYNFIL